MLNLYELHMGFELAGSYTISIPFHWKDASQAQSREKNHQAIRHFVRFSYRAVASEIRDRCSPVKMGQEANLRKPHAMSV